MKQYIEAGSPVRIGMGLTVLLFLICASARVSAADPRTDADVRCMLVGMRMMTMSTAAQRANGAMLAIYYFGRIDSQITDGSVERLLEEEAGKVTEAQLREDAVRCGRALEEKGRELQRIGRAFSRAPKAAEPNR